MHLLRQRPEASLDTLSHEIGKNAALLSEYLKANALESPSFEAHGPAKVLPDHVPGAMQRAREELIAASVDMFHLAVGPSEFLPHLAVGLQHISILSWLLQCGLFQLVPLNGTISYAKLAETTDVTEQRLKSIIRMAMTTRLFREHEEGSHVGHSATSALIARDADTSAYATYFCKRTTPMVMGMTEAHRLWGLASMKPNETAYNAAFRTQLPFFEDIAQDEEREAEFARYMKSVRSSEGVSLKHLVVGFDWESVQRDGTVVDVGGSIGGAAFALAAQFPHLNFVVQDRPENTNTGRQLAKDTQPEHVASRVTFQAHDFFEPETVRGADIYLLRMILHDWSDQDSLKILSNIVGAMAKSSRLLIMDTVLPRPGSVPVSVERIARARDLTMLQAFNTKERELQDWISLLALLEPRVELISVKQPPCSAMSVLEVSLAL